MKSMIEFVDGTKRELEEAAPVIDLEDKTLSFMDIDCVVVTDDIDLKIVKRVIFEPGE